MKNRTKKVLKAARGKKITYKARPIRIISNFSMEILKARRAWTGVLHVTKDHRYQNRILYSAKLSVIMRGKRKLSIIKNIFCVYF